MPLFIVGVVAMTEATSANVGDCEPSMARTLTGDELVKSVGLLKLLREDFASHGRQLFSPGFWALVAYRIGCWGQSTRPRLLGWPALLIYVVLQRAVRNVLGIELQRTVKVGRRLTLAHQHGIVIHKFATIGDDVLIRHSVTFGRGADWQHGVGPVIGNQVEISPGVVLVGNITIGNDVSIGPNCVVSQSVPDNRVLFVPNPRVFPKSDESKSD